MGIDYSSVGGIGVEFTDEMAQQAMDKGLFTEEEWCDDPYGCMEAIRLPFAEGGNAYSGDAAMYLLVEGSTLGEVSDNAPAFISRLAECGIEVTTLNVISESHVY